MSDYVAFLRGINVSGRRIAMGDLAECVAGAGVTNVRTVLATGNVLFTSDDSREAATARLTSAIGERFGFDARLFVKTLPELAEIAEACPFERGDAHDGAVIHTYVTFAADAGTVENVLDELGDGQDAAGHGDVLFWQTPKGSSLENPVAKALARARFKELSTTRNINTVEKILAR